MGSVKSDSSADETLVELSQFQGDYEANSKIKKLPYAREKNNKTKRHIQYLISLIHSYQMHFNIGGIVEN